MVDTSAQFEYKIATYEGASSANDPITAMDWRIQWLNDYGISSWELVAVVGETHFFKRKLPDNDD